MRPTRPFRKPPHRSSRHQEAGFNPCLVTSSATFPIVAADIRRLWIQSLPRDLGYIPHRSSQRQEAVDATTQLPEPSLRFRDSVLTQPRDLGYA